MFLHHLSDEEILDTLIAERWKKEAREYWEKWLPKWSEYLKKQRKFEERLNQHVVNALRTWSEVLCDLSERPEVREEKDFLKRAGKLKAADHMAEELAKQMWLLLPPEKEALLEDETT